MEIIFKNKKLQALFRKDGLDSIRDAVITFYKSVSRIVDDRKIFFVKEILSSD